MHSLLEISYHNDYEENSNHLKFFITFIIQKPTKKITTYPTASACSTRTKSRPKVLTYSYLSE